MIFTLDITPPRAAFSLDLAKTPVGLPTDARRHHQKAIDRGAECWHCTLKNAGRGPVMGQIVPNAPLAFVGEAPNRNDVEEGKNFVGASGIILDEAIERGGGKRSLFTVINTLLCAPPAGQTLQDYLKDLKLQHKIATDRFSAAKKRGENPDLVPPLVLPTEACFPRLQRDLTESNSKTTCAVGGEAVRQLAKHFGIPYGTQKSVPGAPRLASIKKQHGSPVVLPDGRIIMASLHPAFALRGNAEYMPVIREDLARAVRIALRGHIDWYEPEFILNPTIDVAVNVMELMRRSGARMTVDIETDDKIVRVAKIRCVGLGAVIDGREIIIVVPLMYMNGRSWWLPGAETRVRAALRALLDEAPLAGQNLAFDTAILLRDGLMGDRGKLWFDTLLAAHNSTHSELPKDLGFLAAREFEAPRWKEDADAKSVDNVDDRTLHIYNFKDVLGTMRLVAPMVHRVNDSLMVDSFMVDTQLAPIARDMGDLGLPLNEAVRRDTYEKLDRVARDRAAKVRGIVGGDFNPNSFRQVARWLFVDQKLTPAYDTDGKEWDAKGRYDEEDDDKDLTEEETLIKASTNEQSLLRLLDQGVPNVVRDFIDTLLMYRGMEKVKGTYLGYKYDDETGKLRDVFRERKTVINEWYGSLGKTIPIWRTTWKIHVVPCVTGDTWTLTANGPRQIASLPGWPTEGTATSDTRGLQLHDGARLNAVSALVNPGVQATWRVKTVLGLRLTATPHHRVVVAENFKKGQMWRSGLRRSDGTRLAVPIKPQERWRRVDELAPGDYIKVPIGMNVWAESIPRLDVRPFKPSGNRFDASIRVPTEVTKELAHFAGVYNADGSLHDSSGTFTIRITNRSARMRHGALLSALFGAVRVHIGAEGCSVTSIALKTWVEDIGLGRRIENKGAPLWILSSPWEIVAEYIRGCALDSNCNLIRETTPIWVYTGTERLACEMQMLLLNHGIPAAISDKRTPSAPQKWSCVVTGHAEVAAVCAVTGQAVPLPKRTGDRHRPKYVRRENVLWLRVTDVVSAGPKQVYDVTVPSTHAFWSNGFVSHNTGRWSSSPNVQNWPERIVWDIPNYQATKHLKDPQGIINTRAMVEAVDGHTFVGADYSAAELWLYAIQAGDELLLRARQTKCPVTGKMGLDPHSYNYACMMGGTDPQKIAEWYTRVMAAPGQVKKYCRNIAKRMCFLIIYGGQRDKLYKIMVADREPDGSRSFPDLTPEQVFLWFNNWHSTHPWTGIWQSRVVEAWKRYGFVASIIDGRKRFYLGGIDVTAMPNHAIQSSCASIINRALIQIAKECPHRGWSELSGPVLQVHDFLALSVPIGRQRDAEHLLEEHMPYTYEGVRLGVEVKSHKSWAKI